LEEELAVVSAAVAYRLATCVRHVRAADASSDRGRGGILGSRTRSDDILRPWTPLHLDHKWGGRSVGMLQTRFHGKADLFDKTLECQNHNDVAKNACEEEQSHGDTVYAKRSFSTARVRRCPTRSTQLHRPTGSIVEPERSFER
jgi:hypothetical protein